MKYKFALFMCSTFLAGSGLIAQSAAAQTKAYRQTNFASSAPGVAANSAPNLIDPWGIAFLPGQPFFLAANGSGSVSPVSANGVQASAVAVPASPGAVGRSMPTGIASDGSGVFGPASARFQYVVVTQGGTIAGFATSNGAAPAQATLVRDDSASGAVYTALALLHPDCCAAFVAVANFNGGLVNTFTSTFDLLAGPGSFQDPNLPAGYAPFGMQLIGNQLFITYAVQDAAKQRACGRGRKRDCRSVRYAGELRAPVCNGRQLECSLGCRSRQRKFRPFQRRHSRWQFRRRNHQRI